MVIALRPTIGLPGHVAPAPSQEQRSALFNGLSSAQRLFFLQLAQPVGSIQQCLGQFVDIGPWRCCDANILRPPLRTVARQLLGGFGIAILHADIGAGGAGRAIARSNTSSTALL